MIAHVGSLPAEELLFPFLALFGLVVAAWLYLRGLVGLPGVSNVWRRFLGFASSILLLLVVFSPPVDSAADALFSVHMAQHVVLIVAVPVLFTYSRVLRYIMMGVPRRVRHIIYPVRRVARRAAGWLTIPTAAVFFAMTLWAWHLPVLYDAAVGNEMVHALEHVVFVLAGLVLWGVTMDTRRGFVPRSMLVFGTAFHSGLLGALLVLAPHVLYRSHLDQTLVSISPLRDQQLAGLIMWVPMGAVFLVTVAIMVLRVLSASESDLVGDA
jgi:putative membrane protein